MSIAIILDVNELYHTIGKCFYGRKFSYMDFLRDQKHEGEVYHAAACLDNVLDRGRDFVLMLKANDYFVVVGCPHVLLPLEAMKVFNHVDGYIFGTGSEVYIPLFDWLMKHGKSVHLISPNVKPNRFDVNSIIDIKDYLYTP